MSTPCCRCGGPTAVDEFGNGVCIAGTTTRTCGFWWRRSGRCDADWNGPVEPAGPGPTCAWCSWDHAVYFTPTHTTAAGEEHRYHSPASGFHRLLVIVRPRDAAAARATRQLRLSPRVMGVVDGAGQRERLLYAQQSAR